MRRSTTLTRSAALAWAGLAVALAGCGSAAQRRAEQAEMVRDTCVSLIERAFPANWPLIAAAAEADPAMFGVDAGGGAVRPVDLLLTRCLP